MNVPLMESNIAGTGIAAVQGLSGITKGNTVFIEKQEKITKSFLSSTVVVNGLCTRSYLSLGFGHTFLLLLSPLSNCSAHRLSTLYAPRDDARFAQGLWSHEGDSDHGRVWRDLLDHCHSHHRDLLVQVEQL